MKGFKIKRKISTRMIALMIMCIMTVLLLGGCGSSTGAQTEKETAAAAEETATVSEQTNEETAQTVTGETQSSESEEDASSEEEQASAEDVLKVQVLKVGKADAMVLTCGGQTMVIDCGEEEDGQEVVDYLLGQGIEKVDVLLITHFDKDHVGGADTVVEQVAVDRIILPAYEGTSSEYSDFMLAVEAAGITPERVTQTQTLQLGSATATVEPPASYEIEDSSEEYDNNFSLITTVEFGSKRMVFTGDIEKQRIREWLAGGTAQQCDVLKVPHHGYYNAALEELFSTLHPSYAVICDSEKNPAADKTLELLKKYGADYLETKDGDITILCDGENIEIHQ